MDYFAGPGAEADNVASAKVTARKHKEFSYVLIGIGYSKIISLKVKR